jgi:hypothetical protein
MAAQRLYLSDLPAHDMTTDYLLLAEQRKAEADLKEKYERMAVELKVGGGGELLWRVQQGARSGRGCGWGIGARGRGGAAPSTQFGLLWNALPPTITMINHPRPHPTPPPKPRRRTRSWRGRRSGWRTRRSAQRRCCTGCQTS